MAARNHIIVICGLATLYASSSFWGCRPPCCWCLLAEPYHHDSIHARAFRRGATTLVSTALRFYALGLIALTAIEDSSPSPALSDTLTPVLSGGLQMAMWASVSGCATRFSGAGLAASLGGLAWVSVCRTYSVGVLLWLVRGKLGG